MLNSGKNIGALRDKKKYSNSRVVRNCFSERSKNHNPPPPPLQVKWSVPKFIFRNTEIHTEYLS